MTCLNSKILHSALGLFLLGFAGCQVLPISSAARKKRENFQLEEGPDRDSRIVTHARINGVPVRLMFDTGCEAELVILSQHAKKLGVPWTKPPASDPPISDPGLGRLSVQWVNLKRFNAFGVLNHDILAGVAEVSDRRAVTSMIDEPEGIVGWPTVRSNLLIFDLPGNFIGPLESVPTEAQTWTRFSLVEEDTLALQFADDAPPAPFASLDFGGETGPFSDRSSPGEGSSLKSFEAPLPENSHDTARKFSDEKPSLSWSLAELRNSKEALPRQLWTRPALKMAHWIPGEATAAVGAEFHGGVRRPPVIVIDTGNDSGLMLSAEKWQEWKSEHPRAPMTLLARWMAGQGVHLAEVGWAEEIRVGDLVFRGVMVQQADPAYRLDSIFDGNAVVLGLEALKRVQLVVDYPNRMAYLIAEPDAERISPNHNRIGAQFFPADPESRELIAHVLAGTPAAESDIRDGDILLKVDGHDLTGWPEQPKQLKRLKLNRAAGSKISLTLKRGEEILHRTVVTRDILGPKKTAS